MLTVRSFRVFFWVLSLVTVARAACDSRDQVSSWENTTFIDAGWKTPSSPLRCQRFWNSSEVEPLESVRGHYDITRYSLLSWNCFLDSPDGPSTPHVAYCVDAVGESTDVPPPPPPSTQRIEPLSAGEPLSTVILWPRPERAPGIPEHEKTTPRHTPRPSLTTLSGVTLSNSVFSRHAKNSSATRGLSAVSSSYGSSTWPTATVPHDIEPTLTDIESVEDEILTMGNILRERNGSDVAPYLPHFDGKRSGYELPCDGPETEDGGVPEVCHLTRHCTEEDELPTCERGNCRCKPIFCSRTSECEDRDLCRPMDQVAICRMDSKTSLDNGKEGTCSCEPKHTYCSFKGGNAFCAEQFNCTRWSYDVQRHALCVKGSKAGASWCECKETECAYGNWWNETVREENYYGGDWSACAEIQCPYDDIFETDQEPACRWDPSSAKNGTCFCKPAGD